MLEQDRCCTLVPYFEIAEGKMEAFEQLCQQFIKKTEQEPKCLHYGFSFSGNLVHCREGYQDAEAILAHLDNVGSLLEETLKLAKIIRLEVHAPETEIAKLKEPLSGFNTQFFTLKYGFRRY